MLFWSMKKGTLLKKLHKPVHPVVAATAIIGVVLLTALSPFIMRALSRLNFAFPTPPKITYVHVTPIPNITAVPNVPISTLTPSFAPTPTLAPGQKAIYTFYIQATTYTTSDKGLELEQSDTGKMFTVDIGTLIIVNFGRVSKFHVSASSPQAIFTNFGRPAIIHLPNNALGAFRVYRAGLGTINVTETD